MAQAQAAAMSVACKFAQAGTDSVQNRRCATSCAWIAWRPKKNFSTYASPEPGEIDRDARISEKFVMSGAKAAFASRFALRRPTSATSTTTP